MNTVTSKIIKVILMALFFLCLLDMPYGFYQLVRIASLMGFIILAYYAKQDGKKIFIIIYFGLALLFQPFFKIALGKQIWNIFDVIIGIGLLISMCVKHKKR